MSRHGRRLPPRDERMTLWEIGVLEAAELVAKRMTTKLGAKYTPKCVRALIDKVEEGDSDA